MHILPSTALSATHTHAGIYCRATSVRTAPRLLAFARARVKVSQTLFFALLLLLLLCRRRRQALKAAEKKIKQQKSSESQTSLLGISIYNLVLHHVVLSCFFFVQVYLLFAAPAAAAIVVSHSHSRCCCNFIGCACVGLQPILCPQSNSLAHSRTHDYAQVCVSFLHTFLISQFALFALCPQPHRGKRPITFKCQLKSNGLKSLQPRTAPI